MGYSGFPLPHLKMYIPMDCVSPSNFLVILIPRELFKGVWLYKHGLVALQAWSGGLQRNGPILLHFEHFYHPLRFYLC